MKSLPRVIQDLTINDLIKDMKIKTFIVKPIIGIYFLILKGRVIYVGQSIDIYNRINSHKKDKDFDNVMYIKCNEEELTTTEDYYIIALNPPLNKTHMLQIHYNEYRKEIREYNRAKKLKSNKNINLHYPIRPQLQMMEKDKTLLRPLIQEMIDNNE